MVSEIWNICIAQTLKMIVLIFDNQTANDQRYPDIGHLKKTLLVIILSVCLWILPQVDKGARLELSFSGVKDLVWEKVVPRNIDMQQILYNMVNLVFTNYLFFLFHTANIIGSIYSITKFMLFLCYIYELVSYLCFPDILETEYMRSHLLIGAASSGSGKTTFTLGLLRALRNRSLRVQPFKCGPDYIDTRHHKMAAGCASVNLDGFMMSEGHIKDLYARYTSNADVAVTEGVMGLFDGYDAMRGSSAEISGLLRIPIVLVVNAKSTAYSVAPLLYGFRNFRKDLNVVGAVFNFVASESHYSFLRQACEDAGVEALGYLPKCADVEIPSRHLGLSLDEDFCFEEFADRVACLVEEHVDIDRLLAITALPERQPVPRVKEVMRTVSKANLNIAIARDPAFNFSYEENIHFLSTLGKITYFSPLRDDCLPEADFVYLPGGYPELYLSELSMNSGMRESIHSFVEWGKLLAECGGMMYLCKVIGTDGITIQWRCITAITAMEGSGNYV